MGGFDFDDSVAAIFAAENPEAVVDGDFHDLDVRTLVACDIYDGGAPCQTYSVAGRKAGKKERGMLMFEQLEYLRHHQPLLGVFEQVPNFQLLCDGAYMREFVETLAGLGYTVAHKILEARHFDSCQHRERLFVVAVRDDIHRERGDFEFPAPVSATRPAKTVLAPLPTFEGERFPLKDFLPCDPVRYDSGLIKVGSVFPHSGRGCTVWSPEGLLPTQRCGGQGPAGATGLVLREGVPTRVTVEESMVAQQLPERMLDDYDITQPMVGNAVPTGMVFHLGKALLKYAAPYLGTAASTSPAALPTLPPQDYHTYSAGADPPPASTTIDCSRCGTRASPPRLSPPQLHELRCAGFGRAAVRLLEWKWWMLLQRRALHAAISVLRQQRKGTPRDLRAWTAHGLALIANSFHGIGDDASFFEAHCVSLLWWNWRPHLWEALREGQRLPLSAPPPRCFKPNAPTADHPNVDREFRRLIRLGYLEGPFKAGDRELHCVNAVLGVPKKDSPDKPRMCVNMTGSGVNGGMDEVKFLYPSFDDCVDLVYPGAWLAKVDLTDGFFHRLVHRADRKYLGLKIPESGDYMRYRVFPFGLSVSPHYFCAAVSEVHRRLRLHKLFRGAPVLNLPGSAGYDPAKPVVYQVGGSGKPTCAVSIYVDDAMISAPTYADCREAIKVISRVFVQLGLREKRSKRELPSRRCMFLGIEVDTSGGSVSLCIPPEKLETIRRAVRRLVDQDNPLVNRRSLASLVGLLSFFGKAIPSSRAFLRRLYGCLHGGAGDAHDYDRDITLTHEGKLDLAWWDEALHGFTNDKVVRGVGAVVLKVHTDASKGGWGCTVEEYGKPSVHYRYGLFASTNSEHTSNYRELLTVYRALREAKEVRPGVGLQAIVYTDNSVTESCINTGTSRSAELLPLVKEIGLFMVQHGVHCKAVWMPGRMLIQQGADPLSRGAFPYEHLTNDRRAHFDPYFAALTVVPEAVQRAVREAYPQRPWVQQPQDWLFEELEGKALVLTPPPAATRSCVLHYFDAHRRHSASTSAVALIAGVASSEWFRLLKYFRDYIILRYDECGSKLLYPIVLAHSPALQQRSEDDGAWTALKAALLPQTRAPPDHPAGFGHKN